MFDPKTAYHKSIGYASTLFRPLSVRKVVAARGVEAEEYSGVVGKFGGPCRGRTYGPLIKSGNACFFRMLAIATVSPSYIAVPTH